MNAYRKFLYQIADGFYLAVLSLAALLGWLLLPIHSPLASAVAEARLVSTLSVLMAGACLAKGLTEWIRQGLTLRRSLTLLVGTVLSLAVLPLWQLLPFVLQGYVFPFATGLILPYLLPDALWRDQTPRRLPACGATVTGALLILVSTVALCGSLSSSAPVRLVLCRYTALPLLWCAPLFAFYTRRCSLTGPLTAVTACLLPLCPLFGVFDRRAYPFFLLALLAFLAATLYDMTHHRAFTKIPALFKG